MLLDGPPEPLRSMRCWGHYGGPDGKTPLALDGSGERLDTHSPAAWTSYEDSRSIGGEKIGFTFTDDDGLWSIDVDSPWGFDADGKRRRFDSGAPMDPEVRSLLAVLKTHAVLSPSMCGVRIVGRGDVSSILGENPHGKRLLPPIAGKRGEVTLWRSAHFSSWTPHLLPGAEVEVRAVDLATLLGAPAAPPRPRRPRSAGYMELERA